MANSTGQIVFDGEWGDSPFAMELEITSQDAFKVAASTHAFPTQTIGGQKSRVKGAVLSGPQEGTMPVPGLQTRGKTGPATFSFAEEDKRLKHQRRDRQPSLERKSGPQQGSWQGMGPLPGFQTRGRTGPGECSFPGQVAKTQGGAADYEASALKNYERFFNLPEGTATIAHVKESAAGIEGWSLARLGISAEEHERGQEGLATCKSTGVFQGKWQKHKEGECKPCSFYFKKADGCRKGVECGCCHFCPPGRDKQVKRENYREDKKGLRADKILSSSALPDKKQNESECKRRKKQKKSEDKKSEDKRNEISSSSALPENSSNKKRWADVDCSDGGD